MSETIPRRAPLIAMLLVAMLLAALISVPANPQDDDDDKPAGSPVNTAQPELTAAQSSAVGITSCIRSGPAPRHALTATAKCSMQHR